MDSVTELLYPRIVTGNIERLLFVSHIIRMVIRYLVLHLLARLLHIRLEGNGQDEEEEERRNMEMMSKKKKKVRVEESEAKVEDTVGVEGHKGLKRGWEQEEEKSLENWSTLNELGVRLSRLENLSPFQV